MIFLQQISSKKIKHDGDKSINRCVKGQTDGSAFDRGTNGYAQSESHCVIITRKRFRLHAQTRVAINKTHRQEAAQEAEGAMCHFDVQHIYKTKIKC